MISRTMRRIYFIRYFELQYESRIFYEFEERMQKYFYRNSSNKNHSGFSVRFCQLLEIELSRSSHALNSTVRIIMVGFDTKYVWEIGWSKATLRKTPSKTLIYDMTLPKYVVLWVIRSSNSDQILHYRVFCQNQTISFLGAYLGEMFVLKNYISS